ncbi:nucleotide sugar dehydrogenase [Idiomarina piscisalsi]|uniref:nucleotide sugar dehydrogenase n=1 Tax=Idiomarina piscisalsi TaxID=1096243 RepID=UPI00137E4544|nr:nucleotide sugar dehydrogenase [Idiomarina piscisalsi]MTJ02273.1 nucleotide sugar dehydrogenase [Idiomarina piscisalsi]
MAVTTQQLSNKLKSKEAVIGIVGMGYVGLPLMLRYNDIGFKIIGIDIDKNWVDLLNSGKSKIEHISNDSISNALKNGFEATTDFSRASECDALLLCVPTPLNKYREPDLSYVVSTVNSLVPHIRKNQVMSLESTTYPGTTEEELLPRIEKQGFTVGKDYFLVYSPEREDPGNPNFETRTIPKVVGGHTPACLEVGIALYQLAIDKVVSVSSTKVAEMTKLLENIYRSVNIGLINEMKIVADKMGVDIFEVVDAAATKPFGFTAYYPGPGLGGHCIPIDPFYLTWKAREYGLHTRFIELSGEVNQAMPEYVVGKITDALNEQGKAMRGSKVLVLGIAYKKNVDDVRESPSIEVMELIRDRGGVLDYSDPHVPTFPKMREHFFDLSSIKLNAAVLGSYDAVVITTNHDKFDFEMIKKNAQLIIDTRGVYRYEAEQKIKRA